MMKNLLRRQVVALAIASAIGLGGMELPAQIIEPMRLYLESRDALTDVKLRIESRLAVSPVVMPLASETLAFDVADVQRCLNHAEQRIGLLKSSQDPLAGYYCERLKGLITETRDLLPILEKRMVSRPAFPGETPGEAVPLMISKTPVAPPVRRADLSGPLAGAEGPATGETVSLEAPGPAAKAPVRRIPRKTFFSPIGIRNLLSSAMRWAKSHSPGSLGRLSGKNAPPVPEGVKPLSIPPNGGLASSVTAISTGRPISPPLSNPPVEPFSTAVSGTVTPGGATPVVPATGLAAPGASSALSVTSEIGGEVVVPPLAGPTGVVGVPATVVVMPPLSGLPESTDADTYAMNPMEPPAGADPQVHQRPGMRPIAIMVENHNQARPQTGLEEAEVVYEIPVEGGITRFMAMFYHVAGVVGPVRSCRDYFIDRALEVNALYVHCGGSPQGYSHISKTKALAIDEISNGDPYFRDNSRKAPHNLYTKVKDLIDFMARKWPMELPYQRMPLRYGTTPTVGILPNRGVSIRYHGNYSVAYRYDSERNVYHRYMNGDQHLDRVTLRPVSPGTVLVQEAVMKVIDDQGRQDISFLGKGRGWLLHGGTILPVLWEKKATREFTGFTTERGEPVIFANDRPVWIQVVSPKLGVVFDPPLPGTPAPQTASQSAQAPATKGAGAALAKQKR